MANYILAGFFAVRGICHFFDDNDMVWWDIALVAFNIILGAL